MHGAYEDAVSFNSGQNSDSGEESLERNQAYQNQRRCLQETNKQFQIRNQIAGGSSQSDNNIKYGIQTGVKANSRKEKNKVSVKKNSGIVQGQLNLDGHLDIESSLLMEDEELLEGDGVYPNRFKKNGLRKKGNLLLLPNKNQNLPVVIEDQSGEEDYLQTESNHFQSRAMLRAQLEASSSALKEADQATSNISFNQH
ncbi:hypothetical protein FGO68_gene12962 [Halteria grandinella]|uniref:Uncharacterized protein n=1 Tax=Halteria grandinella TaxID=5974 RepID=A0A8J8NCI3_HALGN|nr:hypothetical protein FGO68_gene12962 [Halteria grandinella]